MLLVITSEELERLIDKFSAKRLSIELLGANQLKVKVSQVSIRLSLEEVLPRGLVFSYKLNAIVNFLAEQFVNLKIPGVLWDKKTDRIHIDFDQIPQKEKLKDFVLRQLILDDQKIIVDFELNQKMEDKA